MVLFNYATKEITAKIVYYGPGLCGKTTNLQFIYDSLPSNNKSKMLSLATKTDRTLFFDFLPLDLGKIRGMRTKLQLYTVPGQVYYNSTRQLVLKGADGVVFVADSQDFAVDANRESFQNLEDNLKRQGVRISEMPVVIQYNKRDLPNALPVKELEEAINRLRVPSFESVATTGIGVEQTLKGVTQLVLNHLVKKYGLEGKGTLEEEIQVLNAASGDHSGEKDSVWADDVLASTVALPEPQKAATAFVVDEIDDADVPLVETELVAPASSKLPSPAFDELVDEFRSPIDDVGIADAPVAEVPISSVEIPLPEVLLSSLPKFPGSSAESAQQQEKDRRASDAIVKEVTIPINLSRQELLTSRKLRLKITLEVNLLP